MRNILIICSLWCLSHLIQAQTYPVQITAQAIPPHPVYISDYSHSNVTSDRLRLRVLLNDLRLDNLNVRLKVHLEGNGIDVQSREVVIGASSLFLEGGVPLQLGSSDLAPYFELQNLVGINQVNYANALPEGVYEVCFQVFDEFTGNELSRKTCASIIIFQNDPPLLSLPLNGSSIEQQDNYNILFQWTPRHFNVSNVNYEFSLVQIFDNYVDPQAAFLSSEPIFTEVVTGNQLVYDLRYPPLLAGYRYAWRVRAFAVDGVDEIGVFDNNGFSEIWSFVYQEPCEAPLGTRAIEVGVRYAKFSWDDSPQHLDYSVSYRERNAGSGWYVLTTPRNQVTIHDLRPGTPYEFRIGGHCELGGLAYSRISEFNTFLDPRSSGELFACTVQPNVNIQNQIDIQELFVNDVITAGDFSVTILELTSAASPFTGKGFINIPWLNSVRVGVEFSGIRVNTDLQLISGVIETTYDADWGNVIFPDPPGGDNITEPIELEFDVTIDDFTVNDNGELVITNPDPDNPIIVTYPLGDDYVFIDQSGDVFFVDEEGNVSQGEIADGGPIDPDEVPGFDNSGTLTQLSSEGVKITFVESGQYGFDLIPDNQRSRLQSYYETISDADGNSYDIIHKAIKNGGSDVLTARIEAIDTSALQRLEFKTLDGVKIDHVLSNDGLEATLTLSGRFSFEHEEIYASILPEQGSNGTQTIAGVFKLWHLTQKDINVKIVPINGVSIPANLTNGLNDIFNAAAVNFNVDIVSDLSIPSSVWGGDNIDVGNSGFFSFYTDEQKAIRDFYEDRRGVNDDTYYIFVTDVPPSRSVSGFMPLKAQFGFLFVAVTDPDEEGKANMIQTVAHELGHGVFGLRHPFQEYGDVPPPFGTTWLMDYANGDDFNHMEWQKMHHPEFELYLFQGDDDGQNVVLGSYFRDLDFGANHDSTFTFLTPSAEMIILPNDVEDVEFYYGYYGSSKQGEFRQFMNFTPGTLKSFSIGGNVYEASVEFLTDSTANLLGYFYMDADGQPHRFTNLDIDFVSGRAIVLGYNGQEFILTKNWWNDVQLPLYGTSSSLLKNVLDFPIPDQGFDEKLTVSNLLDFGSEESVVSDEDAEWAFRHLGVDNKSQFFLRNKIAELKSAFPIFMEHVTGFDYGNWSLCSDLHNITGLRGKFEWYLSEEFCNCELTTVGFPDPVTFYDCESNGSPNPPQSQEDFIREYIAFLQMAIDRETTRFEDYNQIENINDDSPYQIVTAIHSVNDGDIAVLTADAILHIISKFLITGNDTEGNSAISNYESAILKLLQFAREDQLKQLLEGLEGPNKYDPGVYLFEQLFRQIDDSWLFDFDSNNRLALIRTLTNRMLNNRDFYNERMDEAYSSLGERVFILDYNNFIQRIGETIVFGNLIGLIANEVGNGYLEDFYGTQSIDYDWLIDQHLIEIHQTEEVGFFTVSTTRTAELKPFDLVVFANKSNLSLVKELTDGLKLTNIPLPSMVLVYASNTAGQETINQGISTAVDLASLVGSGGVLTTVQGLSKMKKAFLMTDMASSGFSLTATALSDDEDNQQVINVLNAISAITGVIALGDLSSIRNASTSVEKFNVAKNMVDPQAMLPTNAQLETMITKLDELSDADMRELINNYPGGAENALTLIVKYLKDGVDDQAKVNRAKSVLGKVGDAARAIQNLPSSFTRLGYNQSSSTSIEWTMHVNDPKQDEVWFDVGNDVVRKKARNFADEYVPAPTNPNNHPDRHLVDMVLENDLYIKFDQNNGIILLGDRSGNYHAFGQIDPNEYSLLQQTFDGDDVALQGYLLQKAIQLEYLSGLRSRPLVIAGNQLELSSVKTNTILGRYQPDIQNLFEELGSFKNIGLGESRGGINLLNRPDAVANSGDWWVDHNQPWLDRAITRFDDIYLATIPTSPDQLINPQGELIGAYAKELHYLAANNYKPSNISISQWDLFKSWFTKTNLLRRLDDYPNVYTWVSGFDTVDDLPLINKLNELDPDDLNILNEDLINPRYIVGQLIYENPDDLINIWKRLVDQPDFGWELRHSSERWRTWAERAVFVDRTQKGKFFEEETVIAALTRRDSHWYGELKTMAQQTHQVDLDEYELFTQVQLLYNEESYFVADQVFVKFREAGDTEVIEDIIVIEDKLKATTQLTPNQTSATGIDSYTVRNQQPRQSLFDPEKVLIRDDVLSFDEQQIKWFKISDSEEGTEISDIIDLIGND